MSRGATPFSAGISSLDEAHGHRTAGDREAAMRLCVALLEKDPRQLGATALGARLLVDASRPFLAGEVAGRAVDAFVRRGDLPAAVVAAGTAAEAGEDGVALRRTIAAAFGAGSARVADVAPAPPPLPVAASPDGALAALSGEALVARLERALQGALSQDDPVPAEARLPSLPLFALLAPAALAELLGAFTVRDLPTGARVVTQGEEGREAFVLVRGALEVFREAEDGGRSTLAALGPGALFGEMALVSDAPRAASVEAVEPVQLLVVDREALEGLAGAHPTIGSELGAFCRERMLANLLRHSRILGAVAPAERAPLMARFEARSFEPGDVLVTQDEDTDGLYLVASGAVEVVGRDADGDPLRIATLGPGDVVGEISLVLRRPATADVRALHPTIALHLPRDRFQEAIRAHAGLLNELYDTAVTRDEETRSVVAQAALDVEDVVLL